VTRDECGRASPLPVLPAAAIQVGIWLSYIRGGFWGAWPEVGVHPAEFVIVAALAALYVHFGGLSAVSAIFYA